MVEEAKRYFLDIIGVSSTKIRGSGTMDLDGRWKLIIVLIIILVPLLKWVVVGLNCLGLHSSKMMDVMKDCEVWQLNLEQLPSQPSWKSINEERRTLHRCRVRNTKQFWFSSCGKSPFRNLSFIEKLFVNRNNGENKVQNTLFLLKNMLLQMIKNTHNQWRYSSYHSNL